MFSRRRVKKIALGVGILGLVLTLFGSVWTTTVFARFEKLPSNWGQTDTFEGSMTTVDVAFLNQLKNNAVINQLMSTPGAQDLLGAPAVKAILGDPTIGELLNNPELMQLLQDPDARQVLSDPALVGLLSNPDVLKLLEDPAFLAAIGNETAREQLPDQPAAVALLENPAMISLAQDRTFVTILQDGVLTTLATQNHLMELLQNPILGTLLANPAVQPLLADPEALSLLVDPRTQKLMANAADLPTVTLPVIIRMERHVTGTEGEKAFIDEQMMTWNSATGQGVPGFEKTESHLVVDRKTREYLPGTDGGRTGLWTLPFHVKKGRSYATWIPVAQQCLEAKYQGTESIDGLKTFKYVVNYTDLPMVAKDPVSGLPLVADELITTWNEPLTGSTVRIQEYDAVSAQSPSGEKYPRLVYDLKHTEDTVTTLVNKAKDNRDKMLWFGSYMPWMSIAFGIFLTVGAATFIGLGVLRRHPKDIISS
jgi:hypothetical protein